ncbi:MAG: protein kinase domain-containing protein, partial [Nakamurella sp.]
EDLVHRDIKPANILLSDSGQVKLSDFGLARILTAENRLTSGESVIGTAAYFSPEQARGVDSGPPGDIYSLGLVLLECPHRPTGIPGRAGPVRGGQAAARSADSGRSGAAVAGAAHRDDEHDTVSPAQRRRADLHPRNRSGIHR